MVGIGIQCKAIFDDHLKANAELLIGAGGGGHLAVGEGALMQLMVGLTYNFNHYIGMQMSVGKVFALKQDLNNTVIDVGFVFNFAMLIRSLNP